MNGAVVIFVESVAKANKEEGNSSTTEQAECVEAGPISAAAEHDSEEGVMEEEENMCKAPLLKRKQAGEACGSKSKARKPAASREQEEEQIDTDSECSDEETGSSGGEEEMEDCGTDSQPLTDSQMPSASQLGEMYSVKGISRQTRNILNQWSNRLSAEEHEMLREYSSGAEVPDKRDPFPELSLSVDQSGLDKPMGISKSMELQPHALQRVSPVVWTGATEPQIQRATEPQSHGATEPQSQRATEPQSQMATTLQGHRATDVQEADRVHAQGPQSHRVVGTQSHRATESKGHEATGPQSHRVKGPQRQGATGPQSHGAKGATGPRGQGATEDHQAVDCLLCSGLQKHLED
ncbi:unnamed protein product [Arctogadus glacialis]